MSKCGARLLEPVMKVEVITPEDHMGDVIGDLNSRRGMVSHFDDKPGGMKVVQVGVVIPSVAWHIQLASCTDGCSACLFFSKVSFAVSWM